MILTFSPVRMDMALSVAVAGDVVTLNGVALDFAAVPAGAVLPRETLGCDWIAGDVLRDADGALTVPLLLPHGANAPPETLFPAAMSVQDGFVSLPPYDADQAAPIDA